MIYLDHNASTPVDERVLQAMLPFLTTYYGNPSSLYKLGRLTRSAIDTAREQVAALVGVHATQVIFTSGGTEANALALHTTDQRTQLIISAIEHPSVTELALRLKKQGRTVATVSVDNNGLVNTAAFSAHKITSPALVSIMLANNETGCIQAIAELRQTMPAEVIFHTDAVQALGKIPVNFKQLGVQRLSISSHKIYGPKGCGALIVDEQTAVEPLLVGGEQEQSYRAGTENVAAIVGFGKAAELALSELASRRDKLLGLRLQLEQALRQLPNLTIFSDSVERLPNTVQFGISGIDGEMLLMGLDQHNIAVSSGSACASDGGQPSPVLTAMGIAPDLAKSAIRLSLGVQNTALEINQFVTTLKTFL